MNRIIASAAICSVVAFGASPIASAGDDFRSSQPQSFERIATFANYTNNADIGDETVSEIVAATADGKTLVYTDGELETIGFVKIANPYRPVGTGTVEVGGEPTSVAVLGNSIAIVGVNTSESLTNPSGKLVMVSIQQRSILAEIDLGGQPDSVSISPDGSYIAVAIENERDEDVIVDGVEGGLPQIALGNPAGFLAIVDITGFDPSTWPAARIVDLTGLASYGGEDPEPEFVDINADNQAVVSLQENNHAVIVDLASGTVVGDFDFGAVDLDGIDATEDDVISLTESLEGVVREPDAIAWVPLGDGKQGIASANEGDLFGGSRGFSIFDTDGTVLYDAGNTYDQLAARIGHYPEGRSENKGSEPESIEYGQFHGTDYLFVGSERGSFIGVYSLNGGQPTFEQVLAGPLGPEGLLAIPSRGLLVVSGEEDDPTFGVRSTIMIFKLRNRGIQYPQIVSADQDEAPIGWSAMSGMTAVPGTRNTLLAVWDSFYAESRIFTIDTSTTPAVITGFATIEGGTGNFDPEGIAVAPDGTYWIASEGNGSGSRLNRLLQVAPDGTLIAEIGLPEEIEACRAASENRGSLGGGFEGVAVLKEAGGYRLAVAQQRGWDYTTEACEALDDDAAGLKPDGEPNLTRIWFYDPATGDWDFAPWTLAPEPENAAWVGLSEITDAGDGTFLLIERDNRTGDFAELKTVVSVSLEDLLAGVDADDKSVLDIQPALEKSKGWITDKPEGLAVTDRGWVYLITDNDGVDDWSGETWFLKLGRINRLFR